MKRATIIPAILLMILCRSLQAQDFVICIDASGSMRFPFKPTSSTAGTCGPGVPGDMALITPDPGGVHPAGTRYEKAYTALNQISQSFLSLMAQQAAFSGVRVVRFPAVGSATAHVFPATTCKNPVVSGASCVDIFDQIEDNITIECAHGTPLIQGLSASNSLLTAGCLPGASGNIPAGTVQNKMILLLCDGQPTDGLNVTDAAINSTLQSNVCNTVKINAIGIGNYTTYDYYAILNKLATRRGGAFFGYLPTDKLNTAMWPGINFDPLTTPMGGKENILIQLELQFANTLGYALIVDPAGALTPGESREFPVTITALDTSLIFAIHWQPEARERMAAKIILPNGTEITENAPDLAGNYAIGRAPGTVYFLFLPAFIKQLHGNWRLQLQASNENRAPVIYNYSVYTRSQLNPNTKFAASNFGTGDFFNGKTAVQLQDSLMKNTTMTVSYIAPQNWRGNWNAKQKLSDKELEIIRQGLPTAQGQILPWATDTPWIDRKQLYLQKFRKKDFTELFDRNLSTRSLFDDGSHEDERAGDGIFNSKFLELRTPGLYQVLYRLSGTTPDGIPFNRELFFHSYVEVNVQGNWNDSKIEFERLPPLDNQAAARVRISFQDQYANVPLPGQAAITQISPERGFVRGELVDRLDGSYTQDVIYDPKLGEPNITVRYGEVTFPPRKIVFMPEWKFAPGFGRLLIDKDLAFSNPNVYGLGFERYLTNRCALEAGLGFGHAQDGLGDKGTISFANLGLKYILFERGRLTPFLCAGASYLRFEGFTSDDRAPAVNLGGGLNLRIARSIALQGEARNLLAFNLYSEELTHNLYLSARVNFTF